MPLNLGNPIPQGPITGSIWPAGVGGSFGSTVQMAVAEGQVENVVSGVSSYTSKLLIPGGYKLLLGVSFLVASSITGITSIHVGIPGNTTLFANNWTISLGTGSIGMFLFNQGRYDTVDIPIVITSASGSNFTGGALRFAVHYIQLTQPAA